MLSILSFSLVDRRYMFRWLWRLKVNNCVKFFVHVVTLMLHIFTFKALILSLKAFIDRLTFLVLFRLNFCWWQSMQIHIPVILNTVQYNTMTTEQCHHRTTLACIRRTLTVTGFWCHRVWWDCRLFVHKTESTQLMLKQLDNKTYWASRALEGVKQHISL